MKAIITLLICSILVCATGAHASTIWWNCVYVDYYSNYHQAYQIGVSAPKYGLPENTAYSGSFLIGIETDGVTAILTANPNGVRVLSGCAGAWLDADMGDEVSASTIFNQGQYFENDLWGNVNPSEGYGETSVAVSVGEVNYFKIAIQDQAMAYEYFNIFYNGGTPDFIPNTYYGWVEYVVDNQGNLSILNSAIGLDGQSMVVGLIPEPSATALLLLGLAILAAKRRK